MSSSQYHPLFISSDAAQKVFSWTEGVRAIQAAYSLDAPKEANPQRTVATLGKTWVRSLPSIPSVGRFYGVKVMGMAMGAKSPGVEYVIILFDKESSRIAGFVDGNLVTAYRTAATTAAALDKLLPNQPIKLAVLGSGLEASMHSRAIGSIRNLSSISVFSPTPEKRNGLAQALSRELGTSAAGVATPEEAVEGADLVLAAARSRGEQPILYGSWLKDSAAVASIGSTIPQQREIDVSVVERSGIIICDTPEEVLEETGDMIAAKAAGINVHERAFSLNDLLAGRCADKLAQGVRPLYKSVGAGLQDIVIAELVFSKAVERGLAIEMPIEFETKR